MSGKALNNLIHNQNKLEETWLNLVLASYATDTKNLARSQGSEFSNPIYHTFTKGTKAILNYALGQVTLEEVISPLEMMMKLRAVQSLEPSQAVKIIFLLKNLIREELGLASLTLSDLPLLWEIDTRIDQVGFFAFDMFMQCREKIFEIRTMELSRTFWGQNSSQDSLSELRTSEEKG